jgi:hypothetical protein
MHPFILVLLLFGLVNAHTLTEPHAVSQEACERLQRMITATERIPLTLITHDVYDGPAVVQATYDALAEDMRARGGQLVGHGNAAMVFHSAWSGVDGSKAMLLLIHRVSPHAYCLFEIIDA